MLVTVFALSVTNMMLATSTPFLQKHRTPTFKIFYQHRNSVTNIQKSSPTLNHQHHCHPKFTETTPINRLFLKLFFLSRKSSFSSFLTQSSPVFSNKIIGNLTQENDFLLKLSFDDGCRPIVSIINN